MADEEDVLTPSPEEEKNNQIEKRIKDLSGKAKSAYEERDAAKTQFEKAELERQAALKDAEFYKNFNTTASKYQGANEYQDQIREKVMGGYTMDDAMISILAKEGKYQPPVAPAPKPASPAGGSAPTNLVSGEKTIAEMTQAERRAQLMEAERKGDIGLT